MSSDNKPETAAAKLAGEIIKSILGTGGVKGDSFQVTIYGEGRYCCIEENGEEFLTSIIADALESNPLPRLAMSREQLEEVADNLSERTGMSTVRSRAAMIIDAFAPYLDSEPSQPPIDHESNSQRIRAWESVFNLCDRLGMEFDGHKTGIENVTHFIESLVEPSQPAKVEIKVGNRVRISEEITVPDLRGIVVAVDELDDIQFRFFALGQVWWFMLNRIAEVLPAEPQAELPTSSELYQHLKKTSRDIQEGNLEPKPHTGTDRGEGG